MTKELFESGIKVNIIYKDKKKEEVMLFESYAFDFEDMLPVSNLDEAIAAGASFPEKHIKIVSIGEDSCQVLFSENKKVFTLNFGNSLKEGDVSIELVGIRFGADEFDDWKTL